LILASSPVRAACPGPTGLTFTITPLRAYYADFHAPGRLALGSDDVLYIADPEHGQVVVRAHDGRLIERATGFLKPVSVAASPEGVLVGDGVMGAVTLYDADWNPVRSLGNGAGEFGLPAEVVHDARSGRTYVSDLDRDLIAIYADDGSLIARHGGFNAPSGMHLDTTRDEVLLIDQGSNSIKALDLDGNVLCSIDSSLGGFRQRFVYERAHGIWTDAQGRIFIADAVAFEVKVYDRSGTLLGVVGERGNGPGQLRLPIDLAVDSYNRLFVSSASNRRIEIYGLDTYTDPEAFVTARLTVTPDTLERAAIDGVVSLLLEVPGYRAADIDPSSLLANGLSLLPGPSVGDVNANAVSDLNGTVDRVVLVAGLPDGTGTVEVSGSVSGLQFLASQEVVVQALPPAEPDPPPAVDPPSAVDLEPPATDRPTGGARSGGCSFGSASAVDPTLPMTLVASLGFLGRRRSRRGR
jgi:hypothetical protein